MRPRIDVEQQRVQARNLRQALGSGAPPADLRQRHAFGVLQQQYFTGAGGQVDRPAQRQAATVRRRFQSGWHACEFTRRFGAAQDLLQGLQFRAMPLQQGGRAAGFTLDRCNRCVRIERHGTGFDRPEQRIVTPDRAMSCLHVAARRQGVGQQRATVDGALVGIGPDCQAAPRRAAIAGQQRLLHQPLPQILATQLHRLAAMRGDQARWRGPLRPGCVGVMRRGRFPLQRRTYAVPEHHHHPFQGRAGS